MSAVDKLKRYTELPGQRRTYCAAGRGASLSEPGEEQKTRPAAKGIGKVGYEINFNRYFYQYQPPRPLDEINADISGLQLEIVAMLREVIQ